jgi:hypothetical protein
MNFIKTRLPNGSETYINMDVVFTIRKGAGFVTVTTAAGEEIRIAGEESARFLRQIERPRTDEPPGPHRSRREGDTP